ncbi:MAG: PEP-utilizing enzyme [Rickettsiales bacterium]|jgi:phosphohistidine swiveling domain-containing protein
MPILWYRFAEDSSLPPILNLQEKKSLEAIFAADDEQSLWCRALRATGLPNLSVPDGLLRWYGDAPYINWNAMVNIVSGGGLIPEPKDDKFTYRYCYHLSVLWRMVKAHWNISRYVQNHIADDFPLPDDDTEKLVESLALGFCILALTMRIPSKNAAMLQDGLADNSSSIPAAFRRVIAQIKALQHRRNQLSSAWSILFKEKENCELPSNLPEFFWDTPPQDIVSINTSHNDVDEAKMELPTSWQGIPIAGDSVTARAFLVRTRADAKQVRASNEKLVLIFPMARPETTELFSHAAAVLYAQGGALSHAASIAREQNLPSITGLGKKFIDEIMQHLTQQPKLILRVNPSQRNVECVSRLIEGKNDE